MLSNVDLAKEIRRRQSFLQEATDHQINRDAAVELLKKVRAWANAAARGPCGFRSNYDQVVALNSAVNALIDDEGEWIPGIAALAAVEAVA